MNKRMLLFCTPFLISCSFSKVPIDNALEYDGFAHIEINQMFEFDDQYYLYFYSVDCGYCELIKQTVLTFLKTQENGYLIRFCKDIPVCDDFKNNIGVSDFKLFCLGGTPTLLSINKGAISKQFVGCTQIENFIKTVKENNEYLL